MSGQKIRDLGLPGNWALYFFSKLWYKFEDRNLPLHQKCEEAEGPEGRGGAGMEGQRGDKGGVYSGGAHRATSNGVLMSMCELVASQINTLRELGSCEHAPARRSLR